MLLNIRGEMEIRKNIPSLLKLLKCQRLICANSQIPVSVELIDDCLAVLTEINIKKLELNDKNKNDFELLHKHMNGLCLALIQKRHIFIVDRIAQFSVVIRDLLQSINNYRSDRKTDLSNEEITMLADLSHTMEK